MFYVFQFRFVQRSMRSFWHSRENNETRRKRTFWFVCVSLELEQRAAAEKGADNRRMRQITRTWQNSPLPTQWHSDLSGSLTIWSDSQTTVKVCGQVAGHMAGSLEMHSRTRMRLWLWGTPYSAPHILKLDGAWRIPIVRVRTSTNTELNAPSTRCNP